MAFRFNTGSFWKKPKESAYAHARRFLVANPGQSLKRLKPLLPNFSPHTRQCAKCAAHLFHCPLYDLSCLTLCPIHHRELRSTCPDCLQSWERPFHSRKPACNTCGVLPKADWGKTQLRHRDLRKIHWLTRWVERCEAHRGTQSYVSLNDIQGRLGITTLTEHRSFEEPGYGSQYYLAFECEKQGGIGRDRLSRMHVVTHNRSLKSKASNLHVWPELDLDHFPRPTINHTHNRGLSIARSEANVIALITLAHRRILRWQRTYLGFDHRLVWSDFKHMRPEEVREGYPPCDLCIAFSLWCSLIATKFTRKHSAIGSGDTNELLRFANYNRMPNIPAGVFVHDLQYKAWRPSINFERWLFLRASDRAFAEFVSLASWIFSKAANKHAHYRATGYPGADHVFDYSLRPSHILEAQLKDSQLIASYWPESSLCDINLNGYARQRVRQCRGVQKLDWNYIGSVNPAPQKFQQQHVMDLYSRIGKPSVPLLAPWIERNQDGYLKKTWYPHDFQVLRSSRPCH